MLSDIETSLTMWNMIAVAAFYNESFDICGRVWLLVKTDKRSWRYSESGHPIRDQLIGVTCVDLFIYFAYYRPVGSNE